MTTDPPGESSGPPPGAMGDPPAPYPTPYAAAQPTDGDYWQSSAQPGLPPGYYPAPVPIDEPGSSLRERSVFVLVAAGAGVLLGILGGYIWSVVANPPAGLLTERGVFLTSEIAYNDAVVVSLWFLVIGLGLGLLAGIALGLTGRRHGVAVVVAVLVLSALACAVSAWLGIEVFGPDPQAQVAQSSVGDSITSALDISTKIAYLGWPIGGLVGVLVAVSTWTRPKVPTPEWASSNVSPH